MPLVQTERTLFTAFVDEKAGVRYAFMERPPHREHVTREWELIVDAGRKSG